MNSEEIRQSTILIVDDRIENLDVLFICLEEFGFRLMVARSANEMLDRLERAVPDMILLDVHMPEIDGFTACSILKKNVKWCEIPIIFITALSDTIDKVKGFELGAVDYITKPFQQEEVLARIKTHLTIERLKKELLTKNTELKEALDKIKVISGLLPICSVCKKIRDDKGYWSQIESYIAAHSDTQFSHGFCPECYKKQIEELDNMKWE
ncbi:MAG: response regulator [Desulfobacteraceae bacterium]|nr:response regulator [Desulfobacteraceae bacterium]